MKKTAVWLLLLFILTSCIALVIEVSANSQKSDSVRSEAFAAENIVVATPPVASSETRDIVEETVPEIVESAEIVVDAPKRTNIKDNIFIDYPESGSSQVDLMIRDWADEKIRRFIENEEYLYESSMTITNEEFDNSTNFVSYRFSTVYNTKDSVQNVILDTMIFDRETGERFDITDYQMDNDPILNKISQLIRDAVSENEEVLKDKPKFTKGTEPLVNNFKKAILKDDSMVFLLDRRQIGPTAAGEFLEVSIPLTDLINMYDIDTHPNKEFLEKAYEDKEKEVADKIRVAITFDDGPHKVNTKTLLDGLKELDINVTFFLQGYMVNENADLVKRMADEGHEIGNHSFDHKDFTKIDYQKVEGQIDETNVRISEITGQRPIFLRPPYGAINENTKTITRDKGMAMIFWSVDTRDWQHRDPQYVKQYILDNSKDGDIILLHDIHPTSVEGALLALKEMKDSRKYEFLTVSELLNMGESELVWGEKYSKAIISN